MAAAEIRFHLDESVRLTIVRPLRERGIDVTSSQGARLLEAADEDHLAFAAANGRVLVTHDDDFLRIHSEGTEHAGILYSHQQKYGTSELLQALILLHGCISAEEMKNRIEWL